MKLLILFAVAWLLLGCAPVEYYPGYYPATDYFDPALAQQRRTNIEIQRWGQQQSMDAALQRQSELIRY